MAPIPSSLMSSRSKKKEPRYVCLSEAKASHSHKMWTEVSSSVPHFLQMGLLLNPIIYRCLLKVLCPVSRPITTLDCVLLKDNNRAPIARLGPEINPQACLCVLQGPCHNARCCFSIQCFICLLIYCLGTPREVLVQNTAEPNRPLRACWRFHFLSLRHDQGPNIAHSMSGRGVIQCLLGLSYQRRCCFSSLKRFQSCLTVRTNTNIFLWPTLSFSFINTGQYHTYLRLKDCGMFT